MHSSYRLVTPPVHSLMLRRRTALAALLALLAIVPGAVRAAGLADELGRNETRVVSAPFPIAPGTTVTGAALPERLERLGYRRVHRMPEAPGEYFWGRDLFWIFRRPQTLAGRSWPAALYGLVLGGASGRIESFVGPDREPLAGDAADGGSEPWIEPEVLSESLAGDRAPRVLVELDELPERVWRPVLAAEDHRFFDHAGVDAIALARALLANVLSGGVAQGGSTLTQQLVKMRDLSPRRTVGRKVSEAVRALALEAEYDKREILQSYLNHVYFGHVDGLAIYGLGTAARAFFDKDARDLDLGQAALFAAMIQGPNRLSPIRHPEAARERQRWVLSRLRDLGWADRETIDREVSRGLPRLHLRAPAPPAGRRFLGWVRATVARAAPSRLGRGRGVLVQTGIDPLLQEWAEAAVASGLDRLRREEPRLAGRPLSAALVAVDGTLGTVLAYVGGDPRDRQDAFDRARQAARQTGSALKPLVLLQAFDDCGRREPLFPARRVLDEPVEVELPGGPWAPENLGRRFRGPVSVREALVHSLNVPFVRIARWCGFAETAETLRHAGLEIPADPPPAFVLGALGTRPLELAGAFTAFDTLGLALRPLPVISVARPDGARLARFDGEAERVSSPAAAYLVRDLLADAVARGTGRAAVLDGLEAWGKTGSSSDLRDAWFVGGAGSVVAAVWVGVDDDTPLGLTGGAAAVPIWRELMDRAARARPPLEVGAPEDVEARWIQDESGRLVRRGREGAHADLFDRRHLPPHRRLLLPDPPIPPVE